MEQGALPQASAAACDHPPECRTVVTGAAGNLGRALAASLERSVPCFRLVRTLTAMADAPRCHALELSDADATRALFERLRPRTIIHCAALANVDTCEKQPAQAIRDNVDATHAIARWIRTRQPETRLVFISTDQVYDGPGPHTEADVHPRNVYALSKFAAERIAASCPNHLILRTNFVGWSTTGSGYLNWLIRSARSGSAATLFENVLFNPLDLGSLCEAIVDLAGGTIIGTVNLGASGDGWSKAEFGLRMLRTLDLPESGFRLGHAASAGLHAYRPSDMRMDVRFANSHLRRPLPSLPDVIASLGTEIETSGVIQ